jgi:hypothetical protein
METATQPKTVAERLSVVEAPTPTQGRLNPNPQPDDMRRLTELLAGRAIENGKYALEHGQYIDSLSTTFAKALLDMGQAYGRDVLAAEGRRTAQLKRQLGNVAPAQG